MARRGRRPNETFAQYDARVAKARSDGAKKAAATRKRNAAAGISAPKVKRVVTVDISLKQKTGKGDRFEVVKRDKDGKIGLGIHPSFNRYETGARGGYTSGFCGTKVYHSPKAFKDLFEALDSTETPTKFNTGNAELAVVTSICLKNGTQNLYFVRDGETLYVGHNPSNDITKQWVFNYADVKQAIEWATQKHTVETVSS